MADDVSARYGGVSLCFLALFIFSAVSSSSVIVSSSLAIFATPVFIAMKESQYVGHGDSVSQHGEGSASPKAAVVSSASTRTTAIGSVMSIGGALGTQIIVCKTCKLSKTIIQACRRETSTCLKCAVAYKSLTDRWVKHKDLKSWWHALQEPSHVQWYRKNNEHESGTRRRFDDVEYMEEKKRVVGEGDIDEDWLSAL